MRILVAFILIAFSLKSFASNAEIAPIDHLKAKELKAIKLINKANELKPNFNYQQTFVVDLQQIKEEMALNKDKQDPKSIENCDQKLNILIKSIQNYLNS